jgi:hypothetical protein
MDSFTRDMASNRSPSSSFSPSASDEIGTRRPDSQTGS